jgi:AraC family transcriptional regulator
MKIYLPLCKQSVAEKQSFKRRIECVIRSRIIREKMSETILSSSTDARARIMAIRNGEMKPLFNSILQGAASPSASLLIEQHEIHPTDWQTLILPEQVLTLYLRRSTLEYSDGGENHHSVVRAKHGVVIEKRACEQRLRWSSSALMLVVRLTDTALEQAAEATMFDGDVIPVDCSAQDTRLSSLLLALEREWMQGYPAGQLFVDGIEQALAAILVRYDGIARRSPQMYKGGLAPYRMKRVTDFIQAHLEKDITLNELARDVGLSPSHFCSLFRKTSGKTPHQFVLHCRIQHAKTLLAQPSHSILDVALASGFRTHQHFSRIFRRQVGVPPSSYRAQL